VVERGSHLMGIEDQEFSATGLNAIIIPSSIEIIEALWFSGCNSLVPITLSQSRDWCQ
jgi:hypothetical protein